MADITKCMNEECPLKESCYRFLAEDSFYQSYSLFKYDEDEGCEHYWKAEEG